MPRHVVIYKWGHGVVFFVYNGISTIRGIRVRAVGRGAALSIHDGRAPMCQLCVDDPNAEHHAAAGRPIDDPLPAKRTLADPVLKGLSRRGILGTGAAFATAAAIGGPVLLPSIARAARPNAITPAEALTHIMAGNARYAANTSANSDYSASRASRALAQFPIAAVVGCADSRVAPELLFDQGPGDLFVTRVAGNFVNKHDLASLEYGVAVLGVPLIMVLGHTGCGAISATIDVIKNHTKLPGHLPSLIAALRPAVETAIAAKPADLLAEATLENVRQNIAGLKAAKPIIAAAVASGKVAVVGGVYDIATGKVNMV